MANSGLTGSQKVGGIDRNAILDRWSRRDAAKAIAASEGGLTIQKIHNVIRAAREAGDPRALYYKRRRTALPIASHAPVNVGPPRPPYEPLHLKLGFKSRTIFVTQLGMGSAACLLVPVSVSASWERPR